MRTLDEHNKYMSEVYLSKFKKKAGVICPKCSDEMIYKGNTPSASSPPTRKVICPNCGYEGNKVV